MSVFNPSLPAEILDAIFSQVSGKDLLACCLVSHSFNVLCTPHLYRTLSVNLFHLSVWKGGFYVPKNTLPEGPSPRQNAVSSLQKILGAGPLRKRFLLSSIRRIEIYGIENYKDENEWPEQYREMGQLYQFELDVSNLMIQILEAATEVKEFIWDIDLCPSTALVKTLQNHPSINSILFTTVCMHIEYQREYDLEYPDEYFPEYAADREIRRRGRQPNPSLPFQSPIFNPTGFQGLVVFGVHHIGNWDQVLAINSVIKACINTLRCLSLRPCGSCEFEYTNEGCTENGDILIKLLDMSDTGELLKLKTLEIDQFEFHKKAGRYIDFGVLESLAINSNATGMLMDFWETWVNRMDGISPQIFPNLKRFRFVVSYCDEDPGRLTRALESFIDLVSRVPNGLQAFELKYDEHLPASAGELGLWQVFLDTLRMGSGGTLETLILFDQSRHVHGEAPKDIRRMILRNLADYSSQWRKLETLAAEPAHDEWEAFLISISTLPSLKTVLMHDMRPPPGFNGRYIYRSLSRHPVNRFGRQEPRRGVNANFLEGGMVDATFVATRAFPQAKGAKYIGIRVGHGAGRCFYRVTPETGVVQIDEDEFVLFTGEVEVVRWVSPEMDDRATSDLFNKVKLPRTQTVETQRAGGGTTEARGMKLSRREAEERM